MRDMEQRQSRDILHLVCHPTRALYSIFEIEAKPDPGHAEVEATITSHRILQLWVSLPTESFALVRICREMKINTSIKRRRKMLEKFDKINITLLGQPSPALHTSAPIFHNFSDTTSTIFQPYQDNLIYPTNHPNPWNQPAQPPPPPSPPPPQ